MAWPDGWTIPAEWKGVHYDVTPRYHVAPDGLARRLDDRAGLAPTLTAPDTRHRVENGRRQDGSRLDRIPVTVVQLLDTKAGGPDEAQAGHLVAFVKSHNVSATDGEHWTGDAREGRAVALDGRPTSLATGGTVSDDPLLPLGLDSHRYRCCGNGVVSSVAEWIGLRLAAAFLPVALDLTGRDVPVPPHLAGMETPRQHLLTERVGSDAE